MKQAWNIINSCLTYLSFHKILQSKRHAAQNLFLAVNRNQNMLLEIKLIVVIKQTYIETTFPVLSGTGKKD